MQFTRQTLITLAFGFASVQLTLAVPIVPYKTSMDHGNHHTYDPSHQDEHHGMKYSGHGDEHYVGGSNPPFNEYESISPNYSGNHSDSNDDDCNEGWNGDYDHHNGNGGDDYHHSKTLYKRDLGININGSIQQGTSSESQEDNTGLKIRLSKTLDKRDLNIDLIGSARRDSDSDDTNTNAGLNANLNPSDERNLNIGLNVSSQRNSESDDTNARAGLNIGLNSFDKRDLNIDLKASARKDSDTDDTNVNAGLNININPTDGRNLNIGLNASSQRDSESDDTNARAGLNIGLNSFDKRGLSIGLIGSAQKDSDSEGTNANAGLNVDLSLKKQQETVETEPEVANDRDNFLSNASITLNLLDNELSNEDNESLVGLKKRSMKDMPAYHSKNEDECEEDQESDRYHGQTYSGRKHAGRKDNSANKHPIKDEPEPTPSEGDGMGMPGDGDDMSMEPENPGNSDNGEPGPEGNPNNSSESTPRVTPDIPTLKKREMSGDYGIDNDNEDCEEENGHLDSEYSMDSAHYWPVPTADYMNDGDYWPKEPSSEGSQGKSYMHGDHTMMGGHSVTPSHPDSTSYVEYPMDNGSEMLEKHHWEYYQGDWDNEHHEDPSKDCEDSEHWKKTTPAPHDSEWMQGWFKHGSYWEKLVKKVSESDETTMYYKIIKFIIPYHPKDEGKHGDAGQKYPVEWQEDMKYGDKNEDKENKDKWNHIGTKKVYKKMHQVSQHQYQGEESTEGTYQEHPGNGKYPTDMNQDPECEEETTVGEQPSAY